MMRSAFLCFVIFCCADFISASFLECKADTDCGVKNARCTDNACRCPFGENFNLDGTKCLLLKTSMEEDCEDDNQCSWLLGKHKCSSKRQCECEEGWRYLKGRCRRAADFNEKCEEDDDCYNGYDLQAMVCVDNQCTCNDGYYLRGDYDCRPKIITEDDHCSLDSDCAKEGYICQWSRCIENLTDSSVQENIKIIYTEEGFAANLLQNASHEGRAGHGESCSTDEECKLDRTYCYPLTNKCICKRGYFLSNGNCVNELGTACSKKEECPGVASECSDNVCVCRKSYFYSKSNRICQKPMTHDNLFCNNNERCHVYGKEVICRGNTCGCKSNTELDDNFICRVQTKAKCDSDEECQADFTNSFCGSDAYCVCPDDFRQDVVAKACLPNIGAECDDEMKLCNIKNAQCNSEKRCMCIEDFVKNTESSCLPVSEGINTTCQIDSQCSHIVAGSACLGDTCKCAQGFLDVDGLCYIKKYMGDLCKTSKECHIAMGANVQCRGSICQCPAFMKSTEDGLDCESSAQTLKMSIAILLVAMFSLQY